MKYLKNNKGSISVIVTVTLLFVVIIISATFTINSSIRKAQLKTISSVRDTYAEDLSRKNEIYNEICKDVKSVQVAKGNSTIFKQNTVLKDENDIEITIPRGYKIANDSEIDVNKGIVIEDSDSNQWVWVPVEDISEIYDRSNGASQLYEFTDIGYNKQEYNTNFVSEPNVVVPSTDSTLADGNANNLRKVLTGDYATTVTTDSFKAQLQNEFNNMIYSVQKNKGFYIGRYEITGTSSNPTEKPGTQLQMNWHDDYAMCKKLSNNNTSVTTQMIWNCQLQKTLIWLITTGNKTPSQIKDPSTWTENYTGTTGSSSVLKTNNIYDLIGNGSEFGQGAYSDNAGNYGRLCFNSNINGYCKPDSGSYRDTRATMYINE